DRTGCFDESLHGAEDSCERRADVGLDPLGRFAVGVIPEQRFERAGLAGAQPQEKSTAVVGVFDEQPGGDLIAPGGNASGGFCFWRPLLLCPCFARTIGRGRAALVLRTTVASC